MSLTKEQRFFYSRVAIPVAFALGIASAFLAFNGYPVLYIGSPFFFALALGLLNVKQKTTLWLALNKPALFLLYAAALAGVFFIADQLLLAAGAWFYPLYQTSFLLFVYIVLYPFTAIALFELSHFLGSLLSDSFSFSERLKGFSHTILEVAEQILFLAMIAVMITGILFGRASVFWVGMFALLWIIALLIRLGFNIRNLGHRILIALLIGAFSLFLQGAPAIIHAWGYITQPFFFTVSLFGIPLATVLVASFMVLLPLRLWLMIIHHLKIKRLFSLL